MFNINNYKIYLFANDTVYELNEVDDILDININYSRFVSIEVGVYSGNVEKRFQVMTKSPEDDNIKFEKRIDNFNIGPVLNELLDINQYLKKDIDNYNKIFKKGEK